MTKPILLYGTPGGPNPWKVAIILEELNIPYEHKLLYPSDDNEAYKEKFINGRVPAIEDPNTGVAIWESGAIIEYLEDVYDVKNILNITTTPEKYLLKQWLHFQMSGQGPYYGQAAWFNKHHGEKIESAIKRYDDQVTRVLSVLNKALHGKQYLVGDKCTYADLAFVPWNESIPWMLDDKFAALEIEKNYPEYHAWHQRLLARPTVAKVHNDKAKAIEEMTERMSQ